MDPVDKKHVSQTYKEDGCYFPLDLFSEREAAQYRSQLEVLEQKQSGLAIGNKSQLNYPYVLFKFANEIVRNDRLLNAVEAMIGPNIMVWGGTFFIKEPNSTTFVSLHQDLRYCGLENTDAVTAWVALSPVTQENGCMRYVRGSHKNGLLEHKDTFYGDNFLTRGQQVEADISEQSVSYVEMKPGQASFHHGHLLHSSAANNSQSRRIGLALNFIAPHNRQLVAEKDFAMLVRGVDDFGYYEHVPAPEEDLSQEALAWHKIILDAQNQALYQGVDLAQVK